ncbi:hypothetical protein Y695_03624 [Hydrogenophaga sp. T4]|nr:hypothetical protein Y695_03624 [Hydrogenophaga sp. T4]
MNTVNRLKCWFQTRAYCSGSTMKNASTRLRWSPRRVGERLMNSRRMKNETRPNSTMATLSPAAQPTQNTSVISHELRSRAW